MPRSFPQIFLVVGNFFFLQKRDELFLERNPAMMFLLVGDVIQHGLLQRRTDTEGRVSDLPGECSSRRKCLMNPTGGICLGRSDDIGGSGVRGEGRQGVKMNGWPGYQTP